MRWANTGLKPIIEKKLRKRAIKMLNRSLFILAHQIGYKGFYQTYKNVMKNQWMPYRELKEEQEIHLQQTIDFAYHDVPYYHRLFNDLHLSPRDIRRVEDLEKLPILTKETIKKNREAFVPAALQTIPHETRATGGSTGTPFSYRLSKVDRFVGGALLYRGWGYGGYNLGDRMIFLAGRSLDVGGKSCLITKAHEISRNIRKLSSFDMGENEMHEYVRIINAFKPRFIRGYPSSLYFFATWIDENDISIHTPLSIFSASEKLYPATRETLERVFSCEIYDNYGLNDGGVSAYECPEHAGLHIDTERSLMEVVDGNANQISRGEGRVIATSLHNLAMPLIRYDTGDIASINDDICACGRGSRLLTEIRGRSVDVLVTPEGKNVHGWYFLFLFWKYGDGIREYQVVQENLEKIVIRIVPDVDFDERRLAEIRENIRVKSAGWEVEFKCVDAIERTGAGKSKFIINNLNTQVSA